MNNSLQYYNSGIKKTDVQSWIVVTYMQVFNVSILAREGGSEKQSSVVDALCSI
jgi:hypothetical protein